MSTINNILARKAIAVAETSIEDIKGWILMNL